jgi:Flp pilus assembly protein TadG
MTSATTKRCDGRRSRGMRGDERGSVSTELVIATPLLLLLILAVVQFALWQHANHVARTVAQQSVAVARVQGATANTGQDEARTVLAQLGNQELRNAQVSATRDDDTTTVVVTGESSSVLPFLHLPVKAVATGPTERFRPPDDAP